MTWRQINGEQPVVCCDTTENHIFCTYAYPTVLGNHIDKLKVKQQTSNQLTHMLCLVKLIRTIFSRTDLFRCILLLLSYLPQYCYYFKKIVDKIVTSVPRPLDRFQTLVSILMNL